MSTKSIEYIAEQLKLCPFCGTRPHVETPVWYYPKWEILCRNRNCLVTVSITARNLQDAIDAWQKRCIEGGK
jgi:hypothetical protein